MQNSSVPIPMKSLNKSKNCSIQESAFKGISGKEEPGLLNQNTSLPDPSKLNFQDSSTIDFQQGDKYLQIIEANRWLKREIQKLEKWLDLKEIEFEKQLHEQKSQQITKDKEMVSYRFSSFKNLLI